MALQTNLPLMNTSPDAAGNLTRGLGLGANLAQMRQQSQARQMQMDEARKESRQKDMITAFTLANDYDPLSASGASPQDNYLRVIGQLKDAGVEVDEDDLTYTPENAMQLRNAIDAGGKLKSLQQAGETKFQFGQSYVQTSKEMDEQGNEVDRTYLITQRRNPTTGEVKTVRSPVTGGLADKLGRTREDIISDEAAAAAAKAQAAADIELANFEDMTEQRINEVREMAIVEDDIARADGLMAQADATENQVRYIDEAITALNDGANTGWFVSKLPTFKSSTIALEQAIKKLGIENINKATFGALSEKELELALSIDVDDRMNEDDLKKYLSDKKDAMQKLASEQRKLARHIRGGGTIDTWRDLQSGKEKNQADRDRLSGGQADRKAELDARAQRLLGDAP